MAIPAWLGRLIGTIPDDPNRPKLRTISATSLKALLDQQAVHLIDVREPGEFKAAHIAGARLMPLSRFDPAGLPKDRPLVLYCASAMRSATAGKKLLATGVPEDVTHLAGGIQGWQAAGLPVARGG